MLLQTGVAHGTSSTAISGIGFGGGHLGVGVGMATTKGSTASTLARKYMMPVRPQVPNINLALGIVFLLISMPIIITSVNAAKEFEGQPGCFSYVGVTFLIAGVVLLATYPSMRKTAIRKIAEWDARKAYLNEAWVCSRCGHEWQPN